MMRHRARFACVAVATMFAVSACSSDSKSASTTPTTTPTPTTVAATASASTTPTTDVATTEPASTDVATTEPASTEPASTETATTDSAPADGDETAFDRSIVEYLASDDLAGRDNLSPGSIAAQDFLIPQLEQIATPIDPSKAGEDGYKQAFDQGTNLIGLIKGTDLADQYVIVGAHYDHLGSDCTGSGPADDICNGATDNATGVAAALSIGRTIASSPTPPRRSVIIALWDAEEDGLLGSAAYLANPLVPLAQTVGYVNFDIQGTNISPALREVTVAVGAETGGPNLVAASVQAAKSSTLDTVGLSLLFGQGRSDHANFVSAGIPSVFFTDATPPCYHTVGDDASIVDYPKLVQQIATATALTEDLAATDDVPVFTPNTPPATFDDAVALDGLLHQAQPDFTRFADADRAVADQFVTDLDAIVAAGAAAFDSTAVGTLLNGTLGIVKLWSTGQCDGFLGG